MSTNTINSLGLTLRNDTPTITPNNIIFPKISYELEPILKRFIKNIDDIKDKFKIAQYLIDTNETGAEDIWRSQIVFLDSSVDFYIHEITKYGIIKMFNEDWPKSKKYEQMKVYLQFAINLANNPNSVSSLIDEIDTMNSYYCFMSSDKILGQLSYIDVKCKLNIAERNLLDSLFQRRNQIAHQSDFPKGSNTKEHITEQYVVDYINSIEELVINKIHPALTAKG